MLKRDTKGFTLVEIMIVVLIIGIIVAIAVPSFIKAREQSRAKACQEAQQKSWGAVQQWAMEVGAGTTDTTNYGQLVGVNAYLTTTPKCPVGPSVITLPAVNTFPTCPNTLAGHDPF